MWITSLLFPYQNSIPPMFGSSTSKHGGYQLMLMFSIWVISGELPAKLNFTSIASICHCWSDFIFRAKRYTSMDLMNFLILLRVTFSCANKTFPLYAVFTSTKTRVFHFFAIISISPNLQGKFRSTITCPFSSRNRHASSSPLSPILRF